MVMINVGVPNPELARLNCKYAFLCTASEKDALIRLTTLYGLKSSEEFRAKYIELFGVETWNENQALVSRGHTHIIRVVPQVRGKRFVERTEEDVLKDY
jgi:hypothetical protein